MPYNSTLKASLQAAITTPANPKISGTILQQQLLAMVNAMEAGAVFMGAATPSTSPTGEANCFYLAATQGTYTHFLDIYGQAITIGEGEAALLSSIYDGSALRWKKNPFPGRTYLHIMYSEAQPAQDNDMHAIFANGDKWIGICADDSNTAPTKYDAYQWAKFVGENGEQGTPGHNPNCGTYTNIADAPATGQDGDYIVVVSGDPATGIIYKWDATANDNAGGWVSTGAEANEAEFSTGQKVFETPIDETHLENPLGSALAKAEDVVTAIHDSVHTHEEIEFSSTALTGFTAVKVNNVGMTIGASGTNRNKWIQAGTSAYKQVQPGEIYKLVATTQYNARYAFLKDIDGIANNAAVHLSEVSESPHVAVYYGSPVVVTIPSDTHYLWKTLTNSSTNSQNLSVYKGSVVEVEGLSEKVDSIEQQLTGFDYSEQDSGTLTEYKKNNERGYYSISKNDWYGVYNQQETDFYCTRVEISDADYVRFLGYIHIGAKPYAIGYAFEDSDGNLLGNVFAFDYETASEEHQSDYAKEYTVKVPEGAHYFVFPMKYYEIITSSNRYCRLIVGESVAMAIEQLEKEVDAAKNSGSISLTHLVPDNVGQLNVVKRMRKFTDIKWTPAFEISRGASGGGESYFKDKFLEGVEYKGIPYGRSWYQVYQSGAKLDANTTKDYGYPNNEGFKVGTRISLETFITAICNKGTVMELESRFNRVAHDSSFYANICAGSVTAALGSAYYTTNDLDTQNGGVAPNVSGFSQLGRIGSTFADLAQLKLGDVLAKYGVHTAMVTDVIIEKGDVKYIEISESTTQGNANYNKLGGILGGVARRLWWSIDDFLLNWNDYKVLRYTSIASVQYTPSPYVPMADEQEGHAPYTMACLPYMGNGFRYVASATDLNDILKVVVTVHGEGSPGATNTVYDKLILHITRKIEGEEPDEYEENIPAFVQDDEYVYVLLNDSKYKQVAEYEAFAYRYRVWDSENGEYVYYMDSEHTTKGGKTSKCKWTVVNSITNLSDY